MNGWDREHPVIKDFTIQGIPFIALVDTYGNINYTGHPSSIELEDRINQLIECKQTDKPVSQSDVFHTLLYLTKLFILSL